MTNTTRTLIRKLRPILASIVESVRTHFDSSDNQAREAFQVWQIHHIFPPHDPLNEFYLQTAFMRFVYAYLLRMCEEYALVPPFPAGESESKRRLASSMKKMLQVLNLLDNSTYANFVHSFDWFAPGEQSTLQLYHLLKQYHFKTLAADILGKVYNEGFIEQHNRSEKGQFYTPPHIVHYMLHTLEIPSTPQNDTGATNGYRKKQGYLYQTIADLSCGSGSFLLAAAVRKRIMLEQLVADGEATCRDALHILTSTFTGFDLNPFACYLATINLFIQCLPFLIDQWKDTDEDGECKKQPLLQPLLKFSIHCIDALDVQSMARTGFARYTFDYLVGNPPYVSAIESASNLLYRNKIRNSGQYRLLDQKWDLFVPFFERNLQLLQPESGRLGLIVSSGIETEGYAQRLREVLCQRYSLLQIDFFPGLRVFPHTGIEGTMVFVENRSPCDIHFVKRHRHLRANLSSFETLPPIRQLTGTESIFRWRYLPALTTNIAHKSIPLGAIAYIGTGIEAQSSERDDEVTDGKRLKRFSLHDVFVLPSQDDERPPGFCDNGVLGDDVDNYHLRRKRYVAYEYYRPFMRAPRHPTLFRTPEKLLLGETSGGYYDTEQLFTNHSVQVVVPWHALAQSGVLEARGIVRVLRKSQQISGMADLAAISQQFDLRYILAIINSRFIRRYLAANLHQGTRKGRIYPDIWKRLHIKIIPQEQQKEIALIVEAVQDEYKKLAKPDDAQSKGALMRVNELIDEIEVLIEVIYKENSIQVIN